MTTSPIHFQHQTELSNILNSHSLRTVGLEREAEYSDSERNRVIDISARLWTVEFPSLNNSRFRLPEWLCRLWSITPVRITTFSWSSRKIEATQQIQYHVGIAVRLSVGNKSSEITWRKFTRDCPWSIWVIFDWNICNYFESLQFEHLIWAPNWLRI